MRGECASVVAPAFLMWVGTFRAYGRQLREYVVNIWEMCQHHGSSLASNLGCGAVARAIIFLAPLWRFASSAS